ncbi:MAG: DUF4493 domain-containing protein [Bacteroides sp.]|nr:DUF4493 domain-containing protein [Bacteroides sp.]
MNLLSGCSTDSAYVKTLSGQLYVDIDIDKTFVYPDGTVIAGMDFSAPAIDSVSLSIHSLVGGFSHVWTSFPEFPQGDLYIEGTYHLYASYRDGMEGFGKAAYSVGTNVDVIASRTVDEKLTLRPASTANVVRMSEAFASYFTSVHAYLHSEGGDYHDCAGREDEILYLLPGKTSLYLLLTMPDGTVAGYTAAEVTDARAATFYQYDLSLDFDNDTPVVSCTVDSSVWSQALTAEFLSAAPPVISPGGWMPDRVFVLPEGEVPDEPVNVTVRSSSPLKHLNMTVNSPYLNSVGVPGQCDLLNLTDGQRETLKAYGLKWTVTENGAEVELADFLGSLVFLNESQSMTAIGFMAEDAQGRVGEPLTLTVRTTPMDISVVSVPDVMVWTTTAEINVSTIADDFAPHVAIELLDDNGKWNVTDIQSVTETTEGLYNIRFTIPEGSGVINARLLYCQEARADVVIGRYMPSFTLDVDAFATYGCVRVRTADESVLPIIVKNLEIYLNNQRAAVLARYTDTSIIVITGLTPSTNYALTSTMMDNPSKEDFTSVIKFTTESTPSLPNADFEHRKEGCYYSSLPCGGRYSQTTVAIFNWQNHQTIDQQVPREWANTNAKTFSRKSANHNTWYMQPSVFSVPGDTEEASYAVCLRSVAFDLDGQIIPDYTQTGTPYLKYSPIIPEISSRAAGKLFLGSYSFDPSTCTETYDDVVDWRSRPMSLSGYYKYSPSLSNTSDYGLAIIEVYGDIDGKRQVIGSAVAHLPVSNSYTAFKASLTYMHFGVKATGLKVMFASSNTIGTIEEETRGVVTTPDAVTGCSLGSTLWLDGINLSY